MNERRIFVTIRHMGARCPKCGLRLHVSRTMPPTESGVIVQYYRPCVCGWRGKSAMPQESDAHAE